MISNPAIACRMVACREALGDDKEWSFYLMNDSAALFRRVVLERVSSEWGSMHAEETKNVFSGDVAPCAHALLWRDNGDGAEFRLSARVRLEVDGHETTLSFEFPKLYRQRDLPVIDGLGKAGLQVTPSDMHHDCVPTQLARVPVASRRPVLHITAKRVVGVSILLVLAVVSLRQVILILSAPAPDLTCSHGRRRGMCEAAAWLLQQLDPQWQPPVLAATAVVFSCFCVYVCVRVLRSHP